MTTLRARRRSVAVCALLWMVVVADSYGDRWRWPTDEISSIGSGNEPGRPFDVVMSAPIVATGEASGDPQQRLRTYHFAAPGDLFFREAPSAHPALAARGVPAATERIVMRHSDELWTIYRAATLSVPARGGAANLFFGDVPLTFSVLDAVSMRLVNPRALLPLDDALPSAALPWLEFRQGGVPLRSVDLAVGPAILVVPAQRLNAFTMPERIYVLRDGLLVEEVNAIFPGALHDRLLPDGSLLLLETEFEGGRTTIELEGRRFDGSVQRRVLRINVPAPPPAPPLDTP